MKSIGRYFLLKRLGGGGFGEVFLGEDPAIGRQVAIKVFKPKDENLIAFATSSDEEGLEILRGRFLSEAKILASLEDEPNVVGVLDYGELDDGAPYYVMPYLPRSLSDELGKDVFDVNALEELPEDQRPRALPLEHSLAVLDQLLTGLAAAHAKGLIHRDIKPSNLMFSESGQIRIVDFGIAKAPDGQHSTVSHLGLGSRNYMAPEQRESAKHVDARVDVYSAGVVAYRMLTGKLPVGRFADPNVAVPALGRPMNDLLLAMVSLEKQDRPADAGEALAKFREARQSVGDDEGGEATGTWVGQGEAAVRDELKPLRAKIAELVGAFGEIRAKDRPGVQALASIADLGDDDLDRLIDDVIGADKALTGKSRLFQTLKRQVASKGEALDEDELASYDTAAEAVGWDRGKIEQLMQQAVAEMDGDDPAASKSKGAHRSTPKSSARPFPRKSIGIAAALLLVVLAGGWGVMEWRQDQFAAEQAERERAAEAEAEREAWGQAQSADSIEAYRSYLGEWPDGLNRTDAQQRIAALEAQGESLVARIQDYLNRLNYRVPQTGEMDPRTESAIRSFEEAESLPVAGVADEVLLEALQAEWRERDESAWDEATAAGTEAAYENYRAKFPKGQYIDQVDGRIAQARERAAWAEAEQADTIAAYRTYLGNFTEGRYADDASAAIERLEAGQSAAEQAAREAAARRALITDIQTELRRLGRDVSVDGALGPGTADQIRAFERATDRAETGEPTEDLLTALKDADRWPGLLPGETFTDCDACPEMVVIPAGGFMMGSPSGEPGRDDDEGPQHRVRVPAFALAETEVTFAQWDACVAAGGCSHRPDDEGWGKGDQPVINVSWNDAQEYVRWLSEETGEDYRLPSEAEWEYAARAGTTTRFNTGNCISTDQANFDGKYPAAGCPKGRDRSRAVPVGSFAPNDFGLYDLHGNVWELAQDCWNDSYRGATSDGSAWMSGDCGRAVLRGGSWNYGGQSLRSGLRSRLTRGNRYDDVGFRPARSL
ncbi:MAG: SUMF1/EgtB/PvdO family nonheme iron enzyme [Xanthomonadales bacterium]|nr:SUMF1/EgtB/PvdO family nonheme iron enzyme [Xanthomonadales bacterium]